MNNLAVIAVLLYVVASFVLSRLMWRRYLERFSNRCLKRLGYTYSELKYSFEEIIYMVSLPSPDLTLQQATFDQVHIEVENSSWLFPNTRALRVIYTHHHGESLLLAYLSFDRFHIPVLDEASSLKKIKDRDLLKVSTFLFHHNKVHCEIIDEVMRKLHS